MSTCEPYRDALSAMADGEGAPVDADAVQAHLDTCDRCTAFAAASHEISRRLRVTPAQAVPDLTASILAAVDTPDGAHVRARLRQLRVLLALAGGAQLVLAGITLAAAGSLAGHATREAGIFELALAVGFLVVAWRPWRAGGLLPVAAVVALLATATSVADVAAGTTSVAQEAGHLLQLVGTGALWALDRRHGRAPLHPAAA